LEEEYTQNVHLNPFE